MTNIPGLFRLDGKTALVTGAARGIGAAIAEALAQAGAHVMLTDILEEAGRATARAIGDASFLPHDVTDEAQWEHVVAETVARTGGLDILVNNAGIETAALLTQCELADFRRVMEVNVTGVFLGLKHAVRAMMPGGAAGKGGSIVNLSSVAGLVGSSGHVAYHTSKGAVRLMVKAAAVECAQLQTGIRVNSVHPAIIGTEMGTSFLQGMVDMKLAPDFATAEAAVKGAHPVGHFGSVSDVAAAVLYLASPASGWVTGTELVVDGGYTAA